MKKHIFPLALLLSQLAVSAQTNYDMQHIQRERLDRGVVAIKTQDGKVAVSWRKLLSDKADEAFTVYRDGVKLTAEPLTQGGTFYLDEAPASQDAVYEVCGGGIDGSYTLKGNAPVGYIPIPIVKPVSTMSDMRGTVTYSANDASIGDVDGDGQYEIILKWDPSNSKDNSAAGYTDKTYYDCYRLDGTRLWRIDMGRNIRSGAHYSPFLVYDFDGDGKAEFMVKTADGTIDGQGKVIGDSTRDWRSDKKDGTYGRIMEGPEYLTAFDGLTGAALTTIDYIPERGDGRSWGDDHANRSERYLAAVAYLDGIHPCAVFCRGYYTRTVLAAFKLNKGITGECSLDNVWTFDTDKNFHDYAGQGNHNLRVADVDGDGCDEIIYGAMCVDNDGKGLYNTKMGHGDAMHLVAEPKTNKLFVWDVHENRRDGSELHDARTGEVVFQMKANYDVGRGMAADVDPTSFGIEMWSGNTRGLRSAKGELVAPDGVKDNSDAAADKSEGQKNTNNQKKKKGKNKKNDQDVQLAGQRQDRRPPMPDGQWPPRPEGKDSMQMNRRPPMPDGMRGPRPEWNDSMRGPRPDDRQRFDRKRDNSQEVDYSDFQRPAARLSCNASVWWDGDLLRELLDHERVTKYNWKTGNCDELIHFDGKFNNWTKSNACLSADILGDWREEVLVRNEESTELRLYVSPIPTQYRINCLEEDIPYRISVATENVGYNQPPELGYYLGPDM